MKTVAFIVNGDYQSAMGYRARALAARLCERFDLKIAYREGNKIAATFRFLKFLVRLKPKVVYVFDMSYAGVLGASAYRLLFRRSRLLIETGDAIYELMRSTGNRSRFGLWLTKWFERFSLHVADGLIVRGSFHKEWLTERGYHAEVVQDGVDVAEFAPREVNGLRKKLGLEDVLTVGLVGSSVWSERLGMCYGWELIETLRHLKDAPVKGIMIGAGDGIKRLKARCREYGIEDKVLFLGHVPFEELPHHLNLIDVCLSTQTNDLAGRVRTTGKLPLYLAAGRYVLASRVGEAGLVLDDEMLLDYEGVKDEGYPQRLTDRIERILREPELLARASRNVALAKQHFDYDVLAERVGRVIASFI